MSEKKWAFNLSKLLIMFGNVGQSEELQNFIQAACEAHAREEVKKFAEDVRPKIKGSRWQIEQRKAGQFYASAADKENEITCGIIDAALKNRGIE